MTPTTDAEQALWSKGLTLVAGVDEVGRGCIAGPVVAAACILPADTVHIDGVRDSKQLSAAQRLRLVDEIYRRAHGIAVAAASCREIERLNIRVATALAMERALRRLERWDHALHDGPLDPEFSPGRHTGIVDGDSTSLSIACASIIAKVTRDRLMARLARRHPEFGWERNAGYGTALHLAALQAHGCTPHHRRTFAPVRRALAEAKLVDEVTP